MKLCNFHADTPYRMDRLSLPFSSPALGAGLPAHQPFSEAFELYAVWCDRRLSDLECRRAFFRILSHFRASVAAAPHPVPDFRISVEDARLLAGDLSYLSVLRAAGVSSLCFFWSGENALGGAHDTDIGLSRFGRAVLRECFALGIVPDLSHASRRAADEVLSLAERAGFPVIASHSDFLAVSRHSRNIDDSVACRIAALGGVVGICLAPEHLREDGEAGLSDVLAHAEHGLRLIPDALVLGTDFDGIEHAPSSLPDSSALPRLYRALLTRGHTADAVNRFFSGNGERFIRRYLPPIPLHEQPFQTEVKGTKTHEVYQHKKSY